MSLVILCASSAGCGDGSSSRSDLLGQVDGASATFTTTDRPAKFSTTTFVKIKGPKRIKAGIVTLTLVNKGDSPHDAQVLRVEGDHTAKETVSKTIGATPGSPIPDWITDGAGLGTVNPGQRATVIQVLKPGTYYLLDSESGPNGAELHADNGGVAKFEVTGGSGGSLPPTDATITADEYSFQADGIEPGKNYLTFENVGNELHHVIAFPYRENTTHEQVVKELFAARPPEGGVMDRENGVGTAAIDGGQKQIVELELREGKYALVCFVTDRDGGPPHVSQGMIAELEVE